MPKIAIIILSFEILSTINIESLASVNESVVSQFHSITHINKNLLLICSFLSLMIGTIVGLAQIKIKRLLAYSTISHVGFLLLALSINTEDSLESLMFYLIQYSFTNLNTFFIILAFGYVIKQSVLLSYSELSNSDKTTNTDINLISELKGQF